jgi:hypothetical protein
MLHSRRDVPQVALTHCGCLSGVTKSCYQPMAKPIAPPAHPNGVQLPRHSKVDVSHGLERLDFIAARAAKWNRQQCHCPMQSRAPNRSVCRL